MAIASVYKNSSGTIWPIAGDDKDDYTFLSGICLQVNLMTLLDFRLAYYDLIVHRLNHCT